MKDPRSGPITPWRGSALALVTALGALACGQPEPPPPTPPEVSVATPIRRDVTFYQDFTGRTSSVQRAEVRARVPGFLQRMDFVAGDFVKKGQRLFLIEPEPYQAQRDQADAALKAAEANRDRAASDLERLEEAIKTNAVSQQDVTRARAELAQAEASVLNSTALLAQAKIQLQYTDVRSPVAGKVDRNLVDLGNLVGQGEATLLTTVVQMDPLWVYFDLPETIVLQFLGDLRGMGVDSVRDLENEEIREAVRFFVGTQNDEGFPHEGYIDFLSNTVDAATGTVEARGVVPNDDQLLLPGVFVRVRVPGRLMPSSTLVSERAIGTDLGGKYVWWSATRTWWSSATSSSARGRTTATWSSSAGSRATRATSSTASSGPARASRSPPKTAPRTTKPASRPEARARPWAASLASSSTGRSSRWSSPSSSCWSGTISIPLLPIESMPEITPPTVAVDTSYPGANAAVLEETVASAHRAGGQRRRGHALHVLQEHRGRRSLRADRHLRGRHRRRHGHGAHPEPGDDRRAASCPRR